MRRGVEARSRRPSKLVSSLVALAVAPALLAAALGVLISEPFLRWEYGRSGFPEAPGFTDAERLALAVPSTLYLVDASITEDDLVSLRHAGEPLYTQPEIDHLIDVRRLVRALRTIGVLAAALLAVAMLAGLVSKPVRRPVGRGLKWGGLGAVAAIVLVILGAGVAWPLLFVGFHEIFFDAGTWQFSASSGLIRLFPEKFWFDASLILATLVGMLGLLTAGWGQVISRDGTDGLV